MDAPHRTSRPLSKDPAPGRLPLRDRAVRETLIDRAGGAARFDLTIIGGGIHGANAARIAASAGLSVLLLERGDYGEGTSSRSSKMAHGGLRYLELFDFKQVFEGIRARERLFDGAPHLVHPASFRIPVPDGERWFRTKLGIGLRLYDLMVKRAERRHHWMPNHTGAGPTLAGCAGSYLYTDGILNDARLVLENVIAARREGAVCLNYAEVEEIEKGRSPRVRWRDLLGGERFEICSGAVLNCAGPWVGDIGGVDRTVKNELRYSRGVHVLFSTPWKGPSLFLPMPGKARYYFVWPHPAGTMVGTTEREVDQAERDPLPLRDELEEIFQRLERDLPGSELTRAQAHYCFAGVRTLPVRGQGRAASTLSRKHRWIVGGGLVTLLGGKLTTAEWTAGEGVRLALKALGRPGELRRLPELRLPGCQSAEQGTALSWRLRSEGGYSRVAAERLVVRFGARAIDALQLESGSTEFGAGITRAEAALAIETEQAETLDDLMRRRLDLEMEPGHGLDWAREVAALLPVRGRSETAAAQVERYRERMHGIDTLLDSVRSAP